MAIVLLFLKLISNDIDKQIAIKKLFLESR